MRDLSYVSTGQRFKNYRELCDYETKFTTFKSLIDVAPLYPSKLLIRNSQRSCRALSNTEKDLRLPLKEANCGQRDILSEEQNHGIISHLILNVCHPWHH